MTADDIDAPCNKCQYAFYSPFVEPCVSCGFDYHNFKPRKTDVGIIQDEMTDSNLNRRTNRK